MFTVQSAICMTAGLFWNTHTAKQTAQLLSYKAIAAQCSPAEAGSTQSQVMNMS